LNICLGAIAMPNVASVLKEEICRLAKKEIKADTSAMKRAVVQYRRDIAKLKRQMAAQAKEIAFLKAQEAKRPDQPQAKQEEAFEGVRFSARSVKAQRARLKLSAANYGKLVGVSGLTVYSWESGKSRPRKQQFARLVAVRGLGRREALRKLEQLQAEAKKVKKLRRRKPR
jgi:DNA-binding transcriptional regulator YiaG